MSLPVATISAGPDPGAPTNGGRRSISMHNGAEVVENVYLLGRPTLDKFLRFMRRHTVNGAALDEGALADEWRAAFARIRALEKEEAGAADAPPVDPLPPALEALREEFLQAPLVQKSFNTVPTTIALVELDRLVVYQKHIDLAHVSRLKAQLYPRPSEEDIFRFCLPADPTHPPVKWSRAHDGTFVFVSPSNDLRFLGARPLEPGQIAGGRLSGAPAGVVGLTVGFGANFFNAISAGRRLVLHNGSHRAFALRDLGVTRAPCVIQFVASWDELQAVASGELRERPEYYLKCARPPLLRDYFDGKLRKVAPMQRRVRQITVKFEVDEADVPAV
ncbi:MAG: hypothetical protein KGJ60_15665 [Verrucomicrobiota bacterium]|nr:hypothetical protein [Verrucomicrobiota bacterium]